MKMHASAVLLIVPIWLGLGAAMAAGKPGAMASDVSAKVTYCKTCHGLSGQGFHGDVPIPRLAGQTVEYFENQVHAFIEHRRNNPIMYNVAHAMPPAMLRTIAEHFQGLDPKPLGGGSRELAAAGKKIYEEGAGDAIPACATCHGPDGKGEGQFPRLAGQLQDYFFQKLTNWTKERGQDPHKTDPSAIMQPIAYGLSEQQIKAIAAYLSNHD